MKSDCLTCGATGKILVGVVHGNPEADVCPICNGKGYICNHEHIREAYNGSERLVNGERDDDIESVGAYCSDCGEFIPESDYQRYANGSDPIDPRD
jgi:hypothetical protein